MDNKEVASFKNVVENLTKTSNVGYYIIHLKKATERLPIIQDLEHALNIKLHIFDGADGYKLIEDGHPTTCQQQGTPFTRAAGDIGCTVSHINICKDALERNYDYVVIFEDDCQFINNLDNLQSSIINFINLHLNWDLFTLGYDPVSTHNIENTSISKVNRFNLTHALILNKTFINKSIEKYQEYYSNSTIFAIDGLYSNVIEDNNLAAYGPTSSNSFFIQKYGVYSYICERVR